MKENKNLLNSKRALTIKEAAEYACVSRGTVENWIITGLLPYEDLPSRGKGSYRFIRIRKEDLDELLNQVYKRKKPQNETELITELVLLPRNT